MSEQGSSTLSAHEDGRLLERLAGLEKVITPAQIKQALLATERINPRACKLTHEVMLWVVLAMGLLTNMPIRQVFKHCRRMRPGEEKAPCRSSLCEARQRLGVAPVQHLFGQVVRPLATQETPGAFYHQWRLVGMDGTLLDAPDSPANAAAFHRANGARGPGAFPQVRKVSLVEVGTHVELALAMGGWQDSEQTLAQQLLDAIPADALVLEDRGFYSYSLWKTLSQRPVALLFRIKSNMVFRALQPLSDGSFLAKIYPADKDRRKDQNGIVVRVIEYTHNDPQRVGCGEKHRLLTNLLDEQKHPALPLICLYHERWEIELVLDEQKTHQDPRRAEKPAHLRSETPAGVRQEVLALSLGHFVIRALMHEAASQIQLDPDRLSFTGCLHVLRRCLPECDARTPARMEQWYQAVLWEMQDEQIDERRHRINPRVIKRKMSKWPKKRPEHRGPPRLMKSFAETVLMLN